MLYPKPRNIYREFSYTLSVSSGGMSNVQSPKIRNNNPVEPKNHTHKPGRQNGIGQRWIPTGKVFIDSTTKVDSEPPNGSNDDITNPYECNQTLYVSAGTSNSSADWKGNTSSKIMLKLLIGILSEHFKWLFHVTQSCLIILKARHYWGVTPTPINTDSTTITTISPEIKLHSSPFSSRVARLEQEMSEVNKKTDLSADCFRLQLNLRNTLCCMAEQGLSRIKNPGPNTIIYPCFMEALIADADAMDKDVAVQGSNEGTGNILGVPDESTVISRASSEGTGSKPGVPGEEKLILYHRSLIPKTSIPPCQEQSLQLVTTNIRTTAEQFSSYKWLIHAPVTLSSGSFFKDKKRQGIKAMQDGTSQFSDRLNVWEIVDKPFLAKMVIKLKWLWKNQKRMKIRLIIRIKGTTWLLKVYVRMRVLILKNLLLIVARLGSSSDFCCPPSTQVFSNLSDGVRKWHFLMSTEEEVYVASAGRAADHARCLDTRKSTSGGIQFLGDKLVSWMSKKQNCTAMSSAEAEYVALSASCAQVMWMRTQLQDYGFNYNKIPLYCDSQSAIAISCKAVHHSHTKHIHTQYHFIKEQITGVISDATAFENEERMSSEKTAVPETGYMDGRLVLVPMILPESDGIYPGTISLVSVEVCRTKHGIMSHSLRLSRGIEKVAGTFKDGDGIRVSNKIKFITASCHFSNDY
ncbi:hypothetical protein Tco_0084911 [Tanacetum coccineum]